MRSNMPPPPYGAKIQMQSHQSSKPKSHSIQSMQQSSGSNSYHQSQTQTSSNRSLENTNNSSNGMSTYFQNRYTCGINASPESAMSPSISSVATSTSEVSHFFMGNFMSRIMNSVKQVGSIAGTLFFFEAIVIAPSQ